MHPSWLRAGKSEEGSGKESSAEMQRALRKRGEELEERVGSRSVRGGALGRAGSPRRVNSGRGEKRAASKVMGKDSTELAVCLLESIEK